MEASVKDAAETAVTWGGWLFGAIFGLNKLMDRRKRSIEAQIDARILQTVNPPLLAQTLDALRDAVKETHDLMQTVDGKVDSIGERVARIEGQNDADEQLLHLRESGDGNGRVRPARALVKR